MRGIAEQVEAGKVRLLATMGDKRDPAFAKYPTLVESGYPGLVVHGPLIATLLMDLIRRERVGARLSRFAYRAASPLFDTGSFTVEGTPGADGRSAKVWARGPSDALAMTGDVTFAGEY